MFILVLFGYKLSKIFTIDCLASSLFDCIWTTCTKDILKIYSSKEAQFLKEIIDRQKRVEKAEKRIEELDAKIKEDNLANPDKKKDDKPAKKGGKETIVISSPLQQQRMDQLKEAEESKVAISKYNDKLVKLKELTTKLNLQIEKVSSDEMFLQLVDRTGERKFIKSKLNTEANTFLSDKGTYYLCTGANVETGEEIEPLVIDGFAVRTFEEDQTVGVEEVFSLKKDEKDKKGAKKK